MPALTQQEDFLRGCSDEQLKAETERRRKLQLEKDHSLWMDQVHTIEGNPEAFLKFAPTHSSSSLQPNDRCARRKTDCVRCLILDIKDHGIDEAVRDSDSAPDYHEYAGLHISLTRTQREWMPLKTD